MAGFSGPQLQNHLAELGCSLPVVFITGHGDIPTTVQTIKAGADDFLTKPVPKEKLLETIKRALVRYEEVREQDSRIAALRSILSRLTPREHEVLVSVSKVLESLESLVIQGRRPDSWRTADVDG